MLGSTTGVPGSLVGDEIVLSTNGAAVSDARNRARAFDFGAYLRTETVGGMVLLAAAAIALLLANSPASAFYTAIRDFEVGPHLLHLDLSIGEWAKDGLLAIFFFVAGLELKRELVIGELSNIRSALLPVIAAVGGMVVPAALAFAVSVGAPGHETAWAIPVATDIAFVLGVLALTGSWMPTAARVFLLSLAVVDDLGGIIVIAVVFTSGLNLLALLAAVALCALYWFLQHKRIRSPWIYVPLAIATWIAVHSCGIHATIAGVALGLLTRVRTDPDEGASPAMRLEHRLQPWSAGLVVPVFAFFAAGVPVDGEALTSLFEDRVAIGVMVGLVVGKFVGIFVTSFIAVKLRIGDKPSSVSWMDMGALAMLGGVGFTVSLLITELALEGAAAERAKAAVLIASAIASLLAAAALVRRGRKFNGEAADEPGGNVTHG
jgi:Na+:H+ antiporter, NhaA family